jgi:hypothetical protein
MPSNRIINTDGCVRLSRIAYNRKKRICNKRTINALNKNNLIRISKLPFPGRDQTAVQLFNAQFFNGVSFY